MFPGPPRMTYLKLNKTSSVVRGVPSEKTGWLCRVKVHVMPSGEIFQLFASQGFSMPVASGFVSWSKMYAARSLPGPLMDAYGVGYP